MLNYLVLNYYNVKISDPLLIDCNCLFPFFFVVSSSDDMHVQKVL